MNRYICVSLFIVGIMGFYSVAFAENCNLTVKCICESNSLRVVQCPDFSNEAIDCNKVGIPQGTCTVDCGQEVAASCAEIPIECRNNETKDCLVTLPVEAGISGADCALGETNCSGSCVDTNADASNCGACENTCVPGEVCVTGSCESSCTLGETNCSGSCVDTLTNNTNCGSCGNACQPEETCVSGLCEPSGCLSDADCASGQYCGQIDIPPFTLQCHNKKGNGAVCLQQNECASGFCVDNVCCNTPCGGACDSCDGLASIGTCTLVAPGTQGNPSCSPYLCNGTSANCPASCLSDADCDFTSHCENNVCVQ